MYSIQLLSDGTFQLDGGAMHGVVPRSLWEKFNPPLEGNRILLGLNSLLVQTGKEKILIEPGIGTGHLNKFSELYCIRKMRSILSDLKYLNVKPEEISVVIPTHLHFDHAGGVADWRTGRLLYPNARFIIQKKEWDAAVSAHPKNQASYLPEFLEPLKKGRLQFVDGDEEVFPGIVVLHTGGHTHGHQAIFLKTEKGRLAFLGDLVPTAAHVNPLWVMAYDVEPEVSISTKQNFMKKAVNENWEVVLVHDPRTPVGRVRLEKEKFRFEGDYQPTDTGAPISLQSVQA